MIDPVILRRELGLSGKLANLIKNNKKVILAGAGGLTAGYLADEMLNGGEQIEIRKKNGTIIEKIVKKEDGSVNYLGILFVIGVLGVCWYFIKKTK